MAIAERAHPTATMERLGHSTIQITLNTNDHIFPSLEQSLTRAYRTAEPAHAAKLQKMKVG